MKSLHVITKDIQEQQMSQLRRNAREDSASLRPTGASPEDLQVTEMVQQPL